VLEEALDPAWMESHPARYLDPEDQQAGGLRGTEMPRLTREELDQLRSLGYVE